MHKLSRWWHSAGPTGEDDAQSSMFKALQGARSKAGELLVNANRMIRDKTGEVEQVLREKTILGTFLNDEATFAEQQAKGGRPESALPPWAGMEDEGAIKQQCLSLCLDEDNLLREPPAGCDFRFELSASLPQAVAALEADPNLQKLRFALVPRRVSEEAFWRNYFYRVSLIKRAAASKEPDEVETKRTAPKQSEAQPAVSNDDWENELLADLAEYELVAAAGAQNNPDWILEVEKALDEEIESVRASEMNA